MKILSIRIFPRYEYFLGQVTKLGKRSLIQYERNEPVNIELFHGRTNWNPTTS